MKLPIPKSLVLKFAENYDIQAFFKLLVNDGGWIAPTFENSWVNYDTTYNPAGYRKDAQGRVWLRGLIKSGTVDATAFTLPVGYRPSFKVLFGTISNALICRVGVLTDGTVVPTTPASNVWVSLDGLVFYTD